MPLARPTMSFVEATMRRVKPGSEMWLPNELLRSRPAASKSEYEVDSLTEEGLGLLDDLPKALEMLHLRGCALPRLLLLLELNDGSISAALGLSNEPSAKLLDSEGRR